MKYLSFVIVLFFASLRSQAQNDTNIYLIARADDMASFHDANTACIKACKEGIGRSIEVMVPCPWFPEAVKMLNENPSIDVGIHLVLTSEWEGIRWRPLSSVPSLVDKDGYFYQKIWEGNTISPGGCLLKADWKIEDIEKELRAQIELAMKYIPRISHVSAHMGFKDMDPKVNELFDKIAREYKLHSENIPGIRYLNGWDNNKSLDERITQFISSINNMTPGTYVFIEHPGLDDPEMRSALFDQKNSLAPDRQAVTDIYTNKKVLDALHAKGVILISYVDLFKKK
ncbi:MAG: polysaccharide deacetylase family protein [Bacteroidota bacterium]